MNDWAITQALRWSSCLVIAVSALLCSVQLASAGLVPARKSAPVLDEARYRTQVEQTLREVEASDAAAAEQALDRLLRSPHFDALPKAQRHGLLSAAGGVAVRMRQWQDARRLLRRAVAIDAERMQDWSQLVYVEAVLGDAVQSARELKDLLQRWPRALRDVSDDLVFNAYAGTEENAAARLELLQALFAAREHRYISEQSSLWYALALLLIERGEPDRAGDVIRHIDHPLHVVQLRIDRRFDALVDRTDPIFDVALRAQQYVEQARARSQAQPYNLELLVAHLSALKLLGRDAEILRLSSAMLDALAAAEPEQRARYDKLDHERWLMNQRGDALLKLERSDEALLQLEQAGTKNELGEPNVSQRLNLAQVYADLQRPDDALRAIAGIEGMSGYGMMVLQSVRFRAARQKLDASAEEAVLRYMRTYSADAQSILIHALLNAGLLDEAAQRLIALLDAPKNRVEALTWLQHFQSSPRPPDEAAVTVGWTQLRTRPDVRRAVTKYGRIERQAIVDVYAR